MLKLVSECLVNIVYFIPFVYTALIDVTRRPLAISITRDVSLRAVHRSRINKNIISLKN